MRRLGLIVLNILFLALGWLAVIISSCWVLAAVVVKPDSRRAREIVDAYDRLGAATFIGRGRYTISSYAAEAADRGEPWGLWLCDKLGKLDPGHCERSRGI